MVVKIERAAIDLYGGSEQFDKDIFTFRKALEKHAKTKGQAAPTAHPYVEVVVRESGGKYEVIEPASVAPVVDNRTFEERQDAMFNDLKGLRFDASNSGVDLYGVTFKSTTETLTELLAAQIEANDASDPDWSTYWRVGPGQYVKLNRDGVSFLIGAIRKKHKDAFENERHIAETIVSAVSIADLEKIDLTKGW